MPVTFDYKVRDRQGNVLEGQLEGDSMSLVVGKLREMGYLPISVKPKSGGGALKREISIPFLSNRVKLQEVAVVTRQLATMVDSGLTVVRALGILAAQVENAELVRILHAVRLDVEHGSSLSVACAKHPKVFSHLFVTLVQAGEAGGNLDQVLGNIAHTLEKQAELNRAVRSAMIYPAVIACVMTGIFLGMLIFIVPTFVNLFKTLGAKLPLPTQVILAMSRAVLSWWSIVIVLVIAGVVYGVLRWKKTESGHRIWDRAKLRPPIFGPLFHKVALARFASTFSSLVTAGVPILESLDLVTETVGNVVIGSVLQEAKNGVRTGRPLAEPLREHEDLVPALVVQMIEVGEQTGALDGMLRRVAEYYDEEVAQTVGSLTSLLEPVLTLIMGVGVGTMVISLYLPMLTYIKHIPTN